MLKQFLNHLTENKLVNKQDKLLLAVSGGLDSMVMLDLFLQADFQVGVAHVNFQLRGAESDGDEAYVRDYCNQRQVTFYSTRVNTELWAQQHKQSIQMAARELRYAWFNEIMQQIGYTTLATAHHLNDSLETVLLRWVHGSGLGGYTGIPLRSKQTIRPLLFATRQQLETYAKQQNLIWREDTSNNTDAYARNHIRHQVVPKFKELNPALEATFARSQRRLHGEWLFWQEAFNTWKKTFVVEDEQGQRLTISKNGLRTPASGSLLYHLLGEYGFTFEDCESAADAVQAQPGKRFLSGIYELSIDREVLVLKTVSMPFVEVWIEESQYQAWLNDQCLTFESGGKELSADNRSATLDRNKVKFPLVWRPWKAGDYFYPFGMTHRKKVSDFLIDAKVPRADKSQVTVLESDGDIIWVVGFRIDERYRLTHETTEAITFRLT